MNPHEIRIRQAARLDGRRRRLKQNHCAICGLSDLRTLQAARVVTCVHCRMVLQGLTPPVENHHVLGKDLSSFAVLLPANLHAVLTFMGLDHPPAASPDLKALYVLRDWLEIAYEITNREIEGIEKDW
jgi:hypothetical protein